MTSDALPRDYPGIRVVASFEELVATPFSGRLNALCWQRQWPGDFDEVMNMLGALAGMVTVDDDLLRSLAVSRAGRDAIEILLADQQLLRARGLLPTLDCIRSYPRDDEGAVVSTDVYSFHVDSATVPADTYLCSYTGAASEGLRNDEARRRVDVPETRAALLKEYGGEDDSGFDEHLRENCYDLHYEPLPGARPFSFGLGQVWRVAIRYPGCPVPPCIHRAPPRASGQPARLLMIS